ncbi:MAG: exonuclease VII small subunit, partial [Proteobacteria bacterium]|nr:exonuclease VII small subunit [Pseudomonadota bacterium]
APSSDGQKAYISYNNKKDLYKIKGNYRFDNSSGYFNKLTNYNFNFFETDLNIQWNSLDELVNLEGKLDFLIKDLNLDAEMPESTFLRALRIFNLNGIIEGLDNVSNDSLNVNRASGRLLIGKNRAVINTPIIFETDEASMKWKGEILKNKKGQLDELNLDLAMRLKISENIPWYAALFGGMPALAGGVVLENIFEDTIEDVSTINFEVHGTIKKPEIKRLN